MDSIIESWTCQIEGDLTPVFEQLHADVTAVWRHSRIGHRAPGCTPVKGERDAYFTFTGDTGALAAISARVYRRGWLVIVIERYATQPEDIDPDYAPWAEVGQAVMTWLRGWVKEHYGINPTPQRAGLPSWEDYNEPATPDQGREVERLARGASAGTYEKVREAHRLRKQGKQWREVKKTCSHETYARWCFEVTGEDSL